MKKLLYEDHSIIKKEFPFIFHTDTVGIRHDTPNWHRNIEFLCCTQGNGTVKCDTTEYPFSTGDIIAVNTDVVHLVSSDTEVVYHCLIVDKDFFVMNSLPMDHLYFQEYMKDPIIFSEFEKVADAFQSQDPCRNAIIKHSVLGLLILLFQKYALEKNTNDHTVPGAERIKNTITYIQKHFSSNLTLDEIADFAGVSKYYLAREFKKYTNHTIFEYINIVRCKEARRLITDGMSVSSAAFSCGFENMSYFSRAYKKYMGSLPSEIIQQECRWHS